MTWLAPLGLLGLIGVVLLIVIYIIKPNYQQNLISSTFVWRFSLKFKKKRLPVSKLNNILIFLCQLGILTICGLLLARPVLASEHRGDESERIIIIDASANMLAETAGQTRFDRAVEDVTRLVDGAFDDGAAVSIIVADHTPAFLAQRATADSRDDVTAALADLAASDACSYSSANMDAAVALCEEILIYNPDAQIILYTATTYLEKQGITVVDVSHEDDWNAAILDVTAEYNENNHYEINIDLGCFGRTDQLTVNCIVYGMNGKADASTTLSRTEFFDPSEEQKTVTFTTDDFGGAALYSFDHLEVYITVADSLINDNTFFLYGGIKPTIRVQYASSIPNNYFGGAVRTIREMMKNQWSIDFKELKAGETPATEGFDLYIYEHRMPSVLPTDGVVLLVDPQGEPEGAGIRFGQTWAVNSDSTMASGTPGPIMNYVDPSRITIAKYTEVISQDGYDELAYFNGAPVILAKNQPDAKVVVLAFDLNYSSLALQPDFAFLMYNIFNHYIPPTLTSNSFEIGDLVELTARGTNLKLSAPDGSETLFEEGRGQITLDKPGSYTVTQTPMAGEQMIIDTFFVKIPEAESNFSLQVDSLPVADVDAELSIDYEDLLLYFAIALVCFMFIEWWLYTRKSY